MNPDEAPYDSHAKGNPGEDPRVADVDRRLTKGGSAEKRAIDPFEHPEQSWKPGADE